MLSNEEKTKIIQQEWNNQKNNNNSSAVGAGAPASPYLGGHGSPSVQKSKFFEEEQALPKEFFKSITLKGEDIPLSEILKPLVQVLGCHVILGPGIEDKKISVDLTKTTVAKALNIVLYSLGYGFQVKDNDLIILAMETRVYRVVLPPVMQHFDDLTSNESSVESLNNTNGTILNTSPNNTNTGQQIKLGTKILVSNLSSNISLWDDIRENLTSLISSQGKFSINKPAGVVIVSDTPLSHQRISQYFEDLNRRVSQQIEVDVKVVEVSLNEENRFGIDWNTLVKNLKTLNSLNLATNFASQNFTSGSFLKFTGQGSKSGSGISQNGIQFVIDALSKQGHVDIVSQPKVRILNNQIAVIQVGSTQSFIDHTTFEVTQTGSISSISTSQVQQGVTMRLLGNIVGDQIYLSVAPVVTTIDNIRSITSGNTTIEAPQTTTKSINTIVKVKEGETVAIGGLITSNSQKDQQSVPVLSKIPMLGKLFQYSANKNTKTELVIFITPKRG